MHAWRSLTAQLRAELGVILSLMLYQSWHDDASEDLAEGAQPQSEPEVKNEVTSMIDASVSRYAESGLVKDQLHSLPVVVRRRVRQLAAALPAAPSNNF